MYMQLIRECANVDAYRTVVVCWWGSAGVRHLGHSYVLRPRPPSPLPPPLCRFIGESASKAVALDPDRPAKPENIGLSVALSAAVSITTNEVTVSAVDGGDRGGVCDGDGGGDDARVVVP